MPASEVPRSFPFFGEEDPSPGARPADRGCQLAGDVLSDGHLDALSFLEEVTSPDGEVGAFPGGPLHFSADPRVPQSPAPVLANYAKPPKSL